MSVCICRHSQVTSSPPGSLLGAPACKNVTCQASRMDVCSRLLPVVFPFWLCVTARLAGNSCPLSPKRSGWAAVGCHRKPEGRRAGTRVFPPTREGSGDTGMHVRAAVGRRDPLLGGKGQSGVAGTWGSPAGSFRKAPVFGGGPSCLGARCRVWLLDQARPGRLPVTFPPREPGLILT